MWDAQSLSLGRPPSICLAHVDVKTPTYVGPGIYVPRQEIVCKSPSTVGSTTV